MTHGRRNGSEKSQMSPANQNTLEYAAGALVRHPRDAGKKIRQYAAWIEKLYPSPARDEHLRDMLIVLHVLQKLEANTSAELIARIAPWRDSEDEAKRSAYGALISALLAKQTRDVLEGRSLDPDDQTLIRKIRSDSSEGKNTSPAVDQPGASDSPPDGQDDDSSDAPKR